MNWLDELATLLRPAGGGIHTVSTGRAAQEEMQLALYGARDITHVRALFREQLARIPEARGFVLGVPSDVGAGFVRGANFGPQVIRATLLQQVPDWPARMAAAGVFDLGDVFVIPQLQHDEMLSDAQLAASRAALYPDVDPEERARLPVSPLSIAERALDLILAQNPRIAPFVIGGDHSTAWPVAAALARARTDRWAILQPDAHTDLLETRLGVKYCFATWSWHANELFHRDGRLVQVGTRASGRDRAHWESTLGVRQYWAAQSRADPAGALDAIFYHFTRVKAVSVYLSNDIDGTDAAHADATGTPEPEGLDPEWLVTLIRRVGDEIGLLGGDIMEVAPPLQPTHHTTDLAARYLRETMNATLHAAI
jgi:agmatinase